MKKQLMLIVLILFFCFLTSCVKNPKNNDIPMYLHGSYHGECLYESPVFSSMILEKEFVFEENKYNDVIAETKTKINNFFVRMRICFSKCICLVILFFLIYASALFY